VTLRLGGNKTLIMILKEFKTVFKSFRVQIEHAVRTQILIANSVNVLAAIAKEKLRLQHSIYVNLLIERISAFEKNLSQTFLNVKYQNFKEQNYFRWKML
jgi:hypothetical protein